jgi:hypothetical protein
VRWKDFQSSKSSHALSGETVIGATATFALAPFASRPASFCLPQKREKCPMMEATPTVATRRGQSGWWQQLGGAAWKANVQDSWYARFQFVVCHL